MPAATARERLSAWPRAAARAVLGACAAFVALMIAAAARYPGGTWIDRSAPGHDLLRNFFCDVAADRALNGAPNPGAPLATAAMIVIALGLAPFWLLVPRIFPARPRLGAAIRALGVTSAIATALVPLTPSSRFGALHALAVFSASIPGIVAALLATYALLASPATRRSHGSIAAATVLVAAIDAALYLNNVATGAAVPPMALPALQKLAAALLVAWMVATALTAAPPNQRPRA